MSVLFILMMRLELVLFFMLFKNEMIYEKDFVRLEVVFCWLIMLIVSVWMWFIVFFCENLFRGVDFGSGIICFWYINCLVCYIKGVKNMKRMKSFFRLRVIVFLDVFVIVYFFFLFFLLVCSKFWLRVFLLFFEISLEFFFFNMLVVIYMVWKML